MSEHNLPVSDDTPWSNLSKEEINELRNKKHKLTNYGRERLKNLKENQDMKNTDKLVYRFFVIDYYEIGCGRKIFLQISLNNNDNEQYNKKWEQFVNSDFYLQSTEELSEREFLNRYTKFLPYMISHLHREKTLTIWQTYLHFNKN